MEYARKIHLHFVWNELTQAIGRARVVNHACSVLVLSNFAIYDADVIEESQLKSLIRDIPELTEADAMDDSAFTGIIDAQSRFDYSVSNNNTIRCIVPGSVFGCSAR